MNKTLVCFLFIIFRSMLLGQTTTIFNPNPYPSPYLNDWYKNSANLGSVNIINSSSNALQIKIKLTVTLSGKGDVLRSVSSVLTLPPQQTTMLVGNQILKLQDVEFPQDNLREQVVQAGRLPEGKYIVCLQLANLSGNIIESKCGSFTILYPQPPRLISPVNAVSVYNNYPVFQWIPVNVPPDYQVRQTLKIVEVLPGQNPYTAITSNYPHYINENIQGSISFFQYPISGLPLEKDKKYAWQISVVDQYGLPPTSNQGKSEIFHFMMEDFKNQNPSAIKILSPSNNSTLSSQKPEIKWTNNTTTYKQKLTIVEVKPNQSLEQSFYNIPFFTSVYDVDVSKIISDTNMNFADNKDYAVRVDLIDKEGTIIKKGEAAKFHYSMSAAEYYQSHLSTVKGVLKYKFPGDASVYPAPIENANIKLEIRFVLKSKTYTGVGHTDKNEKVFVLKDNDVPAEYKQLNKKLLAATVTNSKGEYTFSFINYDSIGKKVKSDVKIGQTSYEHADYYTGDLYMVAKIILEAPYKNYITNPSEDIEVLPGQTKVYHNLVNARSFGLNVTMLPPDLANQYTPLPLSDMKVYVLRNYRPDGVPKNEGIANPASKKMIQGMEVVGEGVTGGGANDRGKVTFKNLIKNKGMTDVYFLYAESNEESGDASYKTQGKLLFQISIPDDKAEFSDDYNTWVFNKEFTAYPQPPSVWGRVSRSDNGNFVKDVNVQLTSIYPGSFNWEWDTRFTYENGYFPKWDNLKTTLSAQGITNGPERRLSLTKSGFKPQQEQIGILKPGQKYFKSLTITPESFVTGKVANEDGTGIAAYIQIEDGAEVEAKFNMKNAVGKPFPYKFESAAVKAPNQRMIIRPKNIGLYFIDTVTVNITTANQDLGLFTLKKKMHRIYLTFKEKGTSRVKDTWTNLKYAKVRIKVQSEWIEKTTNNGWISFDIASDGNEFPIEVTSSSQYRKYVSVLQNEVSKEYKPYVIGLEKGSSVQGKVYVGKDNKPVPNAHVFFSSGANSVHANTDNNGSYTLEGLPQNAAVTIYATKNANDTTFIGDEKKITLGEAGATLDFHLNVYEGMDITNLMGFPIEVTKLSEQNGNIIISGSFINIKDNQQFSLIDKNTPVLFDTVQIKPSSKKNSKGIPIAEAVKSIVYTNINSLNISIYNTFEANLSDKSIGVHVAKASGEGIIKGEVVIKPNALNTNGSITNVQGYYVYAPLSKGLNKEKIISVFTHDGSNPIQAPTGLRITGANGSSLKFKLNGYEAIADSSLSSILYDTIKLNTSISLYNPKLQPKELKLDIGNVVLHKNKIDPINSTKVIEFGMGNWTLAGKSWFMDNSELTITEGELKTKTVNIPVKKLVVKPDQFGVQEYDLTKLTIGGIIPLYVSGKLILNYDDYKSSWFLYVSKDTSNYCAYLQDLPALHKGAKIFIEAISLYSNQPSTFSVWSAQQPIKIYSVATLRPTTFFSYDNYITISGLSLEPIVPKVNLSNLAIRYMKDNNAVKFMVDPQSFSFENKGVTALFSKTALEAQNTILDENGFRSYGTVFEPGLFDGDKAIESWFYHTPDSTVILVENPYSKHKVSSYWQRMPIGKQGTYLDSLRGSMRVVDNDWSNFNFTGELQGTKGVSEQNTMTFTVYGEVKADNQTLSVKNIPFPFGSISWVYDFKNSRMRGSFNITSQNMMGLELTDVGAECLIDNLGWYFIAGGKVKTPGFGPSTAALLFGDYPLMTQEVKDKFASNSYKKSLPTSFQNNISGFLFSGSVQVPVLVPNIDVDVIVAKASFGLNAGFDAQVWKNFTSTGSEYGVGMLGFLKAHLSMNSITCTEFGASATVEVGATGIYNNGNINLSGCGSLALAAHLTQDVPTVYGCGPTIFSFNKVFNFKCTLTPSKVSFDLGTCSGN